MIAPELDAAVRLEERQGNYWLTLNRSNVLNAFDEAMLKNLVGAVQSVEHRERPLIVTGTGRAFCRAGI